MYLEPFRNQLIFQRAHFLNFFTSLKPWRPTGKTSVHLHIFFRQIFQKKLLHITKFPLDLSAWSVHGQAEDFLSFTERKFELLGFESPCILAFNGIMDV
jgi:hypothetical protein